MYLRPRSHLAPHTGALGGHGGRSHRACEVPNDPLSCQTIPPSSVVLLSLCGGSTLVWYRKDSPASSANLRPGDGRSAVRPSAGGGEATVGSFAARTEQRGGVGRARGKASELKHESI